MQHHYQSKESSYFANARLDIVSLLPSNPQAHILEIGAGTGATLLELKRQNKAQYVHGLELMALPGTYQDHVMIDKFEVVDLQLASTQGYNLPLESFDAIIAGDVLEHLIDASSVIEWLMPSLKSGGRFYASLPNIREIKTMWKIFFQGDFAYSDAGILDRTHLRFFCKKNVIELFSRPGLQTQQVLDSLDIKFNKTGYRRLLNLMTLGAFRGFLPIQHYIIAEKK